MRRPVEFRSFPKLLRPAYGPYRAVARPDVRNDGDTVDFFIDLGFNDYPFGPLRLMGVDAPEVRAPTTTEGRAAREHLFSLVLPAGTPCVIYTKPDPDSFGRYVGVVFVEPPDGSDRPVCVNVKMVEDGHAVPREDWGWSDVADLVVRVETSVRNGDPWPKWAKST